MESHNVYELAMHRGDAKLIAAEMGYRSGGEIPRSWRRPVATSTNLFSGRTSPMMRAKAEILAHDRVNPEAADILLFDLFADVARQRAQRGGDDEDAVLCALTQSYHLAITAFLVEPSSLKTEADMYRAGGELVRALLFVIGDDGKAGTPLMKFGPKKTRLQRIAAWVKSL